MCLPPLCLSCSPKVKLSVVLLDKQHWIKGWVALPAAIGWAQETKNSMNPLWIKETVRILRIKLFPLFSSAGWSQYLWTGRLLVKTWLRPEEYSIKHYDLFFFFFEKRAYALYKFISIFRLLFLSKALLPSVVCLLKVLKALSKKNKTKSKLKV